jgi:hypothetical protein
MDISIESQVLDLETQGLWKEALIFYSTRIRICLEKEKKAAKSKVVKGS